MRVEHIFIASEHSYTGHFGRAPGKAPMREVDSVECVAGRGLKGDRFFDFKEDFKGQVTFFSIEVYRDLCDRFQVYDRDPTCFRRNIVVSGADLPSLIGKEFEVEGIRFRGTQEAIPCFWMESAFHEGAEEAMQGNGGLRARILTSGTIRKGATSAISASK